MSNISINYMTFQIFVKASYNSSLVLKLKESQKTSKGLRGD